MDLIQAALHLLPVALPGWRQGLDSAWPSIPRWDLVPSPPLAREAPRCHRPRQCPESGWGNPRYAMDAMDDAMAMGKASMAKVEASAWLLQPESKALHDEIHKEMLLGPA